jgi:hypothetical protein
MVASLAPVPQTRKAPTEVGIVEAAGAQRGILRAFDPLSEGDFLFLTIAAVSFEALYPAPPSVSGTPD